MSSYEDNGNLESMMSGYTPETILEGVIYEAEKRYMEALANREHKPGVVWLSEERLEGVQGTPDEQVMWFRLGESTEVLPTIDQFDVGIVVVDPNELNPRPVLQDNDDRHFYVRRWTKKGKTTKLVYTGNAEEAVSEARPLFKHSLVKGLSRKLQSYHVQNIRTWTENPDAPDDIVA